MCLFQQRVLLWSGIVAANCAFGGKETLGLKRLQLALAHWFSGSWRPLGWEGLLFFFFFFFFFGCLLCNVLDWPPPSCESFVVGCWFGE